MAGVGPGDRERAFHRLEGFVIDQLGAEDHDALEEFWGEWLDEAEELSNLVAFACKGRGIRARFAFEAREAATDRVERPRLRTMALVGTGTPAVQSNHGKPHRLPAKRAPCRCLSAHISTELPG